MAIKYKHKQTKEIAEYDSVMGLFYVKGREYTDGTMIPYNADQIKNDSNWEYYEDEQNVKGKPSGQAKNSNR